MKEYDPDPNWGKHIVEVEFQQWNYRATHNAVIGGNCKGFDVMEAAFSRIYEMLSPEEDGDGAILILRADDGQELECTDDEEQGDDWLKRMVVSVRIVGFKEEHPDKG